MFTIKTKLIFGYGLMFLLVLVAGISGYFGVSTLSEQSTKVAQKETSTLRILANLRKDILNLRRYEKDIFLNIEDRKKVDSYIIKWEEVSKLSTQDLELSLQFLTKEIEKHEKIRSASVKMPEQLKAYQKNFKSLYEKIINNEIKDVLKANANFGNTKNIVYELEESVDLLMEELDKKIKESNSRVNKQAEGLKGFILVVFFISIILFLLISISTFISINRPITRLVETMNRIIQKGDLSLRMENPSNDEIGQVSKALNGMLGSFQSTIEEVNTITTEISSGNLNIQLKNQLKGDFSSIQKSLDMILNVFNELLSEVLNAANQILISSKQVADSSNSLAQGSTEQASSVDQITATLNTIEIQAKNNAKNAEEASDKAKSVKEQALSGNKEMESMLLAMQEISDTSENISKIIKEIDAIAFQTNILALNAAVEAARAGQHGKGFNVVAEEVRNLASRSAMAAKETANLIEGSSKKVNMGTEIAYRTAEVLRKMTEGVIQVTERINNISFASTEQSESVAETSLGINQISQVAMNAAATAEESSAASIELASQAESFRNMVGKFQIREIHFGQNPGLGEKKIINLG
ncbi:MAG: HAMP domain-containing protein [Leptospiraceae bacterium]|nr:HAMP domain-containing protein [Leptospiraceae bacterium]MCP5502763.1 HAMP domain-containing protein [Leptospiraceae bacterium]